VCGSDDPDIELFTSSDLRGCCLVGTEEALHFMVGVYHQICMPKVDLMLSNELVDHLTKDLEVIGMRVIMLQTCRN
jgi:hypothetical protein